MQGTVREVKSPPCGGSRFDTTSVCTPPKTSDPSDNIIIRYYSWRGNYNGWVWQRSDSVPGAGLPLNVTSGNTEFNDSP